MRKPLLVFTCVCINVHIFVYVYINTYPVLTVPTNARFHVHWSHEAVITQTAIFSRDVGTLATITDIRIIFTFINIWWYKINIKWKEGWFLLSSDVFFPSSSTQIIWSQIYETKLIRCTKSVYFLYLRTISHLASGHNPRCSCIRSSLPNWCTGCRSLRSLSCIHRYLWKHCYHITCQGYFLKKKKKDFSSFETDKA